MEAQKLVPKEGKAMAGFDAEAYINEPRWAHSSLGLERVRDLLGRLGRPQDAVPAVHVAGTNGKGSVCAYLAAMLRAAGYRVGLFTSPGVMGFAERVQVDGQPISPEALHEVTLRVREAAEAVEAERGEHPTEFELMAAVAFEHFRASGCGIAVVEVGLGGRLDATNVIVPEASVIARIGLDHTGVLGTTLAEIAAEKAGIVKPGVPVASWPQEPTAAAVVEARCAELGCELSVPDFAQLRAGAVEAAADGSLRRPFRYRGTPYVTALLGSYQPANAALALEAAAILAGRGWDLPPQARACGIAAARWPGRFEVLAPPPSTTKAAPGATTRRAPRPWPIPSSTCSAGETRRLWPARWPSSWEPWRTRTTAPCSMPWRRWPGAWWPTRRATRAPSRPSSWRRPPARTWPRARPWRRPPPQKMRSPAPAAGQARAMWWWRSAASTASRP